MYFKRLDLYGFKSFAGDTKITFESGVTAIVGPNGCGKSNLADSIKWVLGEQRPTALRGNSMEDVIFNGAKSREPVNVAEVYLTLSNEDKTLPIDYDEVTVGRRVFRSGESEYFINKSKVRLKDIQDLFAGTGVGTVSYSLIEQGNIDLVLSSKPDDRRFIFEEAAGITKYKAKKKEAIRKLEHTEDNIQRLNDIIKEVSRQIGTIERQAKKAEKYKKLYNKLKDLEVKKAHYQYLQLKQQDHDTTSKHKGLKDKENNILQEINTIDSQIESERSKLHEIEEQISAVRAEKISRQAEIENNNSKSQLDKERLEELKNKLLLLDKQKENFLNKIETTKKQIEQVQMQLDEIKSNKQIKQEDLEHKQQLLSELKEEIEQANAHVKQEKESIMELAQDEAKASNELTQAEADLKNVTAHLRRLRMDQEDIELEKNQAEQKKAELKTKAEDIEGKLTELEDENKQDIEEYNALESQIDALNDNITDFNHKLTSYKSKLKFLKDLRERLEGYSNAVKKLLIYKKENRLPFEGLHNSLANLISVKEGFEIPAEISLAPYAENIIIDNCQQAQEAIDFLKTDDLGWANFLPISNFNHTQVKIDESIKENSLGLLSEYIETDPVYRPIVEFLLKDIYCVESKSQAQKLLQITSNPEIKFITKKGQVLSKYQISGGNYARKEETSLIGRDVKIEKLGKNCQELNTKISCLKDDLQQKSSAAESLSAKIEAAKQDIHNLQIKKANIQSEINSADEELSRINKEVILLDSEIDEAQTQKEDLINKKQNRQKELDEVKQQNVKIQNVITSNQESIEEKSQGVQQTLVEITELKTELSSIDEFYSNKKQTYSMLEGNIQETEDNIDNIKQDYAQSEERIGFLHEEIEKLNNKNESLKSECEELEQRIQKISKQKQQVMADMQQTEQHLRSKQSELSDSRQTLHTYEVRNTEYSLKLDNIKDRIYSNYKVKLDEADIEEDKQIDWQKTDAEIDCLRKKVESMADVNLAAFDEHKQLKERFEFLNNQRQDLEEAKESLYKAIKKINRTTTKLFKETFDQIKVTFEEFFKMLFGGGYAHLKLVDENHVLESGIEITARPPGKKPQSISLLSGGEKALTAVALLFAVFKVKPSPFCVLDEIDAPLDESNVDRFAKVLKDFVKTSQFIIITHNKKTIGMADVMYGITMEESGVSKLVSVKFIEEKEKDAQSASI